MRVKRIVTVTVAGQSLPRGEGETLAGNKANLDGALSGKYGVLILGFTEESTEQTKQ